MTFENLSDAQCRQVEMDFEKVPLDAESRRLVVQTGSESEAEQFCLEFLYAYMPASDMVTYSFPFFQKAVRDALRVRREVPWCAALPEEIFLDYVLPVRINNEDLVDCRAGFFGEIFPRVKGLSMRQAVLEVNYWCFEKATYRSTDDRTSSPLTVIRNAFGRCGEESVLCVSALRSVGIPARQCYVPRWAHCDDNHAWVEVWADGNWHCLGACEPEPVLDRGWFVEVSTRAMMVHTRAFSGIVTEPEVTDRTPICSLIDVLAHYAPTKRLNVRVTDEAGKPVSGAAVRFEIINYAELYPIAAVRTDENGRAGLLTGYGDLWVHAVKDGLSVEKKADRFCTEIHLTISANAAPAEGELDLVPPPPGDVKEAVLSESMKARHTEKMNRALQIRQKFESGFQQGEKAGRTAAAFGGFSKETAGFLASANGNYAEILRFLRGTSPFDMRERVLLLGQLRKKDFSDVTAEALEDHLAGAHPFRGRYPQDIYARYILCPHVANEPVRAWRAQLARELPDELRQRFCREPTGIFSWLEKEITDCGDRDYATLSAPPHRLLRAKYGSLASRRIAFVAVCRTLGIPAQLSPSDEKAEFYREGKWIVAEKSEDPARDCRLTVSAEKADRQPVYGRDFTLARLTDGVYQTMGAPARQDGSAVFTGLEAGEYRLLTVSRLLDGSVLARMTRLRLTADQPAAAELTFRSRKQENLRTLRMPSVPAVGADGSRRDARELLPDRGRAAWAFLNVGAEPAEHLLNEILEQPEEFAARREQVLLLVDRPDALSNALLRKATDRTGILAVAAENFAEILPDIRRQLGISTDRLPLVLGLENGGRCLFHFSGYNVGTGKTILHMLAENPAEEEKAQ